MVVKISKQGVIQMNPEDSPVEEQLLEPSEEPSETPIDPVEETVTTETTELPSDTEMLLAMQTMNETMLWNFAVQFIIIGLLFFILVFTAMKAGKD